MLFLLERRRGRELAAQLKALEEQTAEHNRQADADRRLADEYRRQADEERRLAAEALQRAEQRMMQEHLAMMALMVKWLDAIDRNRAPAP